MNIDISTKEYRDLLDILHLAEVVLSGHRKEEDKRSEGHRALIKKLYALARGGELAHLIKFDEQANTYTPAENFEKETLAHVAINEFAEHVFWDELIGKLTERDMSRMIGYDRLIAMIDTDRRAAEGPIRQRYIQEFSMNGVANLEVVEPYSVDTVTHAKTSD